MTFSPRTGKLMTHVERMFDECVLWANDQHIAFKYNELLDAMLLMESQLTVMTAAKDKAVAALKIWRHRAGDITFSQWDEYEKLIDELEKSR